MASIAPLPPTPQQSFSHMAPQGSPPQHQQTPSQPNGLPAYGHSYSMSFDSSQPTQPQLHGQPSYAQSFSGSQTYPNGPVSGAGYSRSFGEGYGGNGTRTFDGKPQIYTVECTADLRRLWVKLLTSCRYRRSTPAFRSTKWKFRALPACADAPTAGSTLHRS